MPVESQPAPPASQPADPPAPSRAAEQEAERKIDGFRPVLKTIKDRRDQYLAHISRELVFDLKLLKEGPKLEFGQIRGVLFKGGSIH